MEWPPTDKPHSFQTTFLLIKQTSQVEQISFKKPVKKSIGLRYFKIG